MMNDFCGSKDQKKKEKIPATTSQEMELPKIKLSFEANKFTYGKIPLEE